MDIQFFEIQFFEIQFHARTMKNNWSFVSCSGFGMFLFCVRGGAPGFDEAAAIAAAREGPPDVV